MKKQFTKNDLHTGDIVETRNGERGVVILDTDSIIWQAGGLDIFEEVYTEDLFVDGTDRDGDIFKVFHDPEGPIGFQKLFGLEPSFVRKNNADTKARSKELSDKYDRYKDCLTVLVLEPTYRKLHGGRFNPSDARDFDMIMSEAPSMTVVGDIKIDRTYIPVPGEENLFFVYNKYQEEWHNSLDSRLHKSDEPMVRIPAENIAIHSRCLVVRKDDAGNLTNIQDDDAEKVKAYLVDIE